MAFTSKVKALINRVLHPLGLHLETLTAERREVRRLHALEEAGYFNRPAFPLPTAIADMDPEPVFRELSLHASRFDDMTGEDRNPVGYSFDNSFFSSPDAEVLYCMVRAYEPRTILEVGCGNSTRISRLAIMDGKIESSLISIDPHPRREISTISDQVYSCPVEDISDLSLFADLNANDILFVDSSHQLKPGNDLVYLYLRVFPVLKQGVLIHIHDIFLPYDYKAEWVIQNRLEYAEQYLVQSMLQSGDRLDALWAGYYLQHTREDFAQYFSHIGERAAQSLWLRKVS